MIGGSGRSILDIVAGSGYRFLVKQSKPDRKNARKAAPFTKPEERDFAKTYKGDWKTKFVFALQATRNFTQSAEIANVSKRTVRRQMEKDPEFGEAVKDAWDLNIDKLEAAAFKRATEGWLEPVFHQGERVGWVRKFSTGLTIFMLKCWRPERYNVIDSGNAQTPAEKAKLVREALEAMGATVEHELTDDGEKGKDSDG